ncbi:MAG: rod shape-determining protein MreC [Phycisphaeraceae bacterium]|nr:rod shape-determining protein MreC [Phycisphaeraceae bacterium]
MRSSLLNQRRVMGLTVILLIITSQLPGTASAWLWSGLRHFKDVLWSPMSDPLNALSVSLRGGSAPLPAGMDQRTLADLRYVRQLEAELDDARQKVEQYERLAGMAKAGQVNLQGVRFLSARVTAWTGRPGVTALTINKGTRQGVEPGMIVTDGINLVGRVVDAGGATAYVSLITSLTAPLEVRIVPPTMAATRQWPGYVQFDPNRQIFWTSVEIQQPVDVGDLAHLAGDASTTGLSPPTGGTAGGWPPEAWGLIVGRVTRIERDADPLNFKRVIVEPMVNLAYLTRVVVLVPMEATAPAPR